MTVWHHLPGDPATLDDPIALDASLADPRLADLPLALSISATTGAPGANGVIAFTGFAPAGAVIELARVGPSGTPVSIGWTTADGSGGWSVPFPEMALGIGTVNLTARVLGPAGDNGAWTAATTFRFTDPEADLRHVGADLAVRLRADAAQGLDATADLQALAEEVTQGDGSPAVLDVPAGTYRISSTLFLRSGSYFDAPGVTLLASPAWQRPVAGSTAGYILGYTMVANAGYASDTITDHDIQIRGVAFDWNGFENFGSAAVRFRSAENILVQDASFRGNEDGTAFMHDDGAVVNNCVAVGTVNYAYDNWEGPANTVVENSVATVARFGGIAFTARGTAATDDHVAHNVSAIGNTIYGADRVGIDVNALSPGSALNDVFVGGNTFVGPGIGISVAGPASSLLVAGNSVSGSIGQPAILVGNAGLSSPNAGGLQVRTVRVEENSVSNAMVSAAAQAAVIVEARGAGIFGNTVAFGSQPWDLWVAATDVVSAGNTLDNWQNAAVLTAWSANTTITDAPGSALTPVWAQMPYAFAGDVLTPIGSGVLDLRAGGFPIVRQIDLQEAAGQIVYLAPGGGVSVIVASAPGPGPRTGLAGTIGAGGVGYSGGLTIVGAAAADTIRLGAGDDVVVLGGTQENVSGGGADTFAITAATAGATIDGGTGASQLVISGGGSVTLGASITRISTIKIITVGMPTTLSLNALSGLTVWAGDAGDTIIAGAAGQVLFAGLGVDVLVGAAGGGDTFAGRAAELEGDSIRQFALGDTIDVTSVGADARFAAHLNDVPGMTTLFVNDGHDGMGVNLQGTLDVTSFHSAPDGLHGVDLIYAPDIYTVTNASQLTHVFNAINQGGPDATSGAAYTMFVGGYLVASGTLALNSDLAAVNLADGANLTIDGAGHTLDLGGFRGFRVDAGDLTVSGLNIVGSGTGVELGSGAGTVRLNAAGQFTGGVTLGGGTLDLAAAAAAGSGAIRFADVATLRVEAGVTVANEIASLRAHDTIVAAGITGGTAVFDPGTDRLTVGDADAAVTLQLDEGGYDPTLFTARPAVGGGTAVVYAACYLVGTRIATSSGEIPIEALRIGDRIVTRAGLRPVKWIGRACHDAARVAANPELHPVRIHAGALGPGVPCRDLLVSPLHGLFVDGALVPAAGLVNGVSIARVNVGPVDYWHVELDEHGVIFAEGAPAESFIDDGSRLMFDNADDFFARHVSTVERLAPARRGVTVPRIEEGWRLDALRRRFATRARVGFPTSAPGALCGHVERLRRGVLEGWALDADNPNTPVTLTVRVAGMNVAVLPANRYRADLDHAGLAGGCCGFTVAVPAELTAFSRIDVGRDGVAGVLPVAVEAMMQIGDLPKPVARAFT